MFSDSHGWGCEEADGDRDRGKTAHHWCAQLLHLNRSTEIPRGKADCSRAHSKWESGQGPRLTCQSITSYYYTQLVINKDYLKDVLWHCSQAQSTRWWTVILGQRGLPVMSVREIMPGSVGVFSPLNAPVFICDLRTLMWPRRYWFFQCKVGVTELWCQVWPYFKPLLCHHFLLSDLSVSMDDNNANQLGCLWISNERKHPVSA